MLSPIKMTEHSSVMDAGWSGDADSILSSIQDEVNQHLNEMLPEVILLLIDKMEKNLEEKKKLGKLEVKDLLVHYVALKIARHHIVRKHERMWDTPCKAELSAYEVRVHNLTNKIKEARKNYYVSKRRYEGGHGEGCSCRGCRCIEDF